MFQRWFVLCLLFVGVVGRVEASGGAETGYDDGFFIRTADKRFSMLVNGFIQARFTTNLGSVNNFDLALGRLAVSGTAFSPNIGYFFQYEGSTFGNNNTVSMLDWWLSYTVSPALTVRMGRMILPFSRQFYTHPGNLLFTDLSSADYAFNLQRALGVELGGSLGFVNYNVMVMNSVRALDGGPTQINVLNDIGWLARLEVPILQPYGYMESRPQATTSAPQLSVGAAIASNPVAARSNFQRTSGGDRTLNITADAGFRVGGLSIQGAYHLRNTNAGSASWTDNGLYAQAGLYLAPQIELAARYSSVSFASPIRDGFRLNGTETELTGGLNYYIVGHGAKIQLDYSLLSNTFSGATATANRIRVQTQILF